MRPNIILVVSVLALGLSLAACGAAVITPVADPPIESTLAVLPTEIATVPAPTVTPVIALTTYADVASGFTFDYPAEWMLAPLIFGSRAPAGYQLTSWTHDPGMVAEIPADGTIIDIALQLWDPKGDLQAFVDQRKLAWDASGILIVSSEELILGNGQPAQAFIVKGVEGTEGYFLFSTRGDNYLVVSGSGELDKIALVARSVR